MASNKRINAQPTKRLGIAAVPLNPTGGSCILSPVGKSHMQSSREPIASMVPSRVEATQLCHD